MNYKYWTSSSVLLRETLIEGFLLTKSPLRIGSGREPPLGAAVNLAVLRIEYDGRSLPYIPGSSLKGVFRSGATAIAKTRGLEVCSGLAKETCMDLKKYTDPELDKPKTLKEYIELKQEVGKSDEAMEAFFKTACLMCKIFGAPSYAGKVHFWDAYPIDEDGSTLPVSTSIRTGIAIDRRTGAVSTRRRALYRVEYVEPGAKFRFRIGSKNLPNYALGLLAKVLGEIHTGTIKLGGFKTRGFGEVEITDLKFKNRDYVGNGGDVMKGLEEGVDVDVELEGLVESSEGWLVADGEKAWGVLKRLMEAWANARLG